MTTGDFFKDTVFARSDPLVLMLCAVFAGFLFCISKDMFRIPERLFGRSAVVIFVSDFCAVVISYLFSFICALHFNHGIIRWYHLIMFAAGVLFYKKTLSATILFILNKIYDIIEKLIKLVFKFFAYPIKKLLKLIKAVCVKAQKHILIFAERQKYKAKCVKYYKAASTGFGLLPYEKGEKKNVKKIHSSRDSFCNSSFDNLGVQASDGA